MFRDCIHGSTGFSMTQQSKAEESEAFDTSGVTWFGLRFARFGRSTAVSVEKSG